MVFALSRHVPVMLVGWSHKYQEVMEQFGLSEYAADYSGLTLEKLQNNFEIFLEHQEEIRKRIRKNLPAVQKSSRNNIHHISKILDEILLEKEEQDESVQRAGWKIKEIPERNARRNIKRKPERNARRNISL